MKVKRESKGKIHFRRILAHREYADFYSLELAINRTIREPRRLHLCWQGTMFRARFKTKKLCRFFGSKPYEFNFSFRVKLLKYKNWLRYKI